MTTAAKAFHRYSNTFPSNYFGGGLPSDHDWLNNPSGNGDVGVVAPLSADANGKKLGGANEGTYFLGFLDDGTSGNVNRAVAALANNTDYLDNLMQRSLALPIIASAAAPLSPVSSLTFPAGTYIEGYSGGVDALDVLFSILDSNDQEIITSGGTKVRITALTGPSPSDIFATGSFSATVSPPIPAGTAYKLYYAVEGTLANMSRDTFTKIKIRGAEEVSATVENLFRLLHGNSQLWNDTWEGGNTIYNITWLGLQGLYNKTTSKITATLPTFLGDYTDTLDTPAAGGYFIRNGAAIVGYSGNDNNSYSGYYTDPIGAIWKAAPLDSFDGNYTGAGTMNHADPISTTIGFAYLGSRATEGSVSAFPSPGAPPSFAAFYAGSATDTVNNTTDLYTRIYSGNPCTLAISTNNITITLTGTDSYFCSGTNPNVKSALVLGSDLLLIRKDSTGEVRAVVITSISDATHGIGRLLDGGHDSAFVGSCTIVKWVRSYFMVGDGASQFREVASGLTNPVKLRNFQVLQPPPNAAADNTDGGTYNAYFAARSNTSSGKALAWGGYNLDGTYGGGVYDYTGFLQGNGSVYTPYVDTCQIVFREFEATVSVGSWAIDTLAYGGTYVAKVTYTGDVSFTLSNLLPGSVWYLAVHRSNAVSYDVSQKISFVYSGKSVKGDSASGSFTLPPRGPEDEVHFFEVRCLDINSSGYVFVRHLGSNPA